MVTDWWAARPHLHTRSAKVRRHADPTDLQLSRDNGSVRFEEILHTGRGMPSRAMPRHLLLTNSLVHRRPRREDESCANRPAAGIRVLRSLGPSTVLLPEKEVG